MDSGCTDQKGSFSTHNVQDFVRLRHPRGHPFVPARAERAFDDPGLEQGLFPDPHFTEWIAGAAEIFGQKCASSHDVQLQDVEACV